MAADQTSDKPSAQWTGDMLGYLKDKMMPAPLPWTAPFTYDAARGWILDATGKIICNCRSTFSDEHNALIAVALSGYAAYALSAEGSRPDYHDNLIEECAQVAENTPTTLCQNGEMFSERVAKAIRTIKFSASSPRSHERASVEPTVKLPVRYEHISYEGDYFYDADGNEVTAAQMVALANSARSATRRSVIIEECAARINRYIGEGPLPGDGTDQTAQRNGLILAHNALMAMLTTERTGQ